MVPFSIIIVGEFCVTIYKYAEEEILRCLLGPLFQNGDQK